MVKHGGTKIGELGTRVARAKIEDLFGKQLKQHKALSSNPRTTKRKTENKQNETCDCPGHTL
jgi:hypothetical protein